MHAVIEYISSGVIICLILGFAGQYASSMSSDRLNLIERNATLGKADRIIDMLLLSTGVPADWGRSYEEPDVLGLASETAIKLYQLDPQKVRRLSISSTDYIPPTRVRDLLGISSSYYMSLKVFPFFNVSVASIGAGVFSVTVLNQWSIPVSNVRVTGGYLSIPVSNIGVREIVQFMDISLEGALYANNVTSADGSCTLSFGLTCSTLIVCANQLNVKSLTTWPSLSPSVVGFVESSMGSVSGYNAETVYRNVNIEAFNYIARLTIWS